MQSTGSRHMGFNSWGTQAQQLWLAGLVAPQHVGSSWTRARTCVPCIGRRILNHYTTREARHWILVGLVFQEEIEKASGLEWWREALERGKTWTKFWHFVEVGQAEEKRVVFIRSGCCDKIPQTGWLINNKNLFFTVLEAWKCKIMTPAWEGEGYLSDCRILILPSQGRRG